MSAPRGAQGEEVDAKVAAEQKKRRRKVIVSVITISVIVHLFLGAGATVWIVAKYFAPPKAVFVAPKKEIIIPAEERDHRLNMAEFDGAAPKPSFTDKLSSIRPSPFSLPDLPKVPMDQVLPLDPAQLITEQVSSLFGTGGIGDGTGNGVGGKSGRNFGMDGLNFFGIKDQARSVVIMIDVSGSMFTRTGDAEGDGGLKKVKIGKDQAFQVVRDAAIELIQKIGPNTRFGIVRWSGGAYSWKEELVAATDANKAAAIEHIQTQIDLNSAKPKGGRPGGTRHDYALEEAFKLKPEVIYMLTDGNATEAVAGGGLTTIEPERIWAAAEAGQKGLETPARLHVIYYVTGDQKADEEHMLRILASRNKGRFKTVKAKNAGEGKKNNRNDRNDRGNNRGGKGGRGDKDDKNDKNN